MKFENPMSIFGKKKEKPMPPISAAKREEIKQKLTEKGAQRNAAIEATEENKAKEKNLFEQLKTDSRDIEAKVNYMLANFDKLDDKKYLEYEGALSDKFEELKRLQMEPFAIGKNNEKIKAILETFETKLQEIQQKRKLILEKKEEAA